MGITIPQRGVIVPKIAPISGRYYGFTTSYGAGTAGTTAIAADTLYAIPFYVSGPMTTATITLNVTATGTATNVHLGVYDADPATGLPRTLLADSGAQAVDTIGLKEPALVQALTPGVLYWLALVANGAVTVTSLNPYPGPLGLSAATAVVPAAATIYRGFTYAALPATWGTLLGYAGTMPFVTVKAA